MSEAVQKELPEKWEWSTLGEVCEKPQYGWTTKASQEGGLHLLRTTDITSGQINWDTVPYCVIEPEDKEKYRISDGDIVVSRAGSVGVSYLITNPEPSVFASYLIRFKPLIDRKYVYYFLKSPAYWNAISEKSAGIALQNVNATKLKEIDIPVAPPKQQKCIVAKIEELFSHIDAGIGALKKAKQLLKQYRQSVLKAAVTGELTKEWREVNKGNNSSDWLKRINLIRQDLIEKKEITKPKKATAIVEDEVPYQIPETWEWARLDDFVLTSVDCPHSTAKYKEQGKKCVRTSDFLPGKLVLDKVRYVTEEEFVERNKRLIPKPNDVLYSREGGILGIACMIPEQEEVCLGQRMMIFRTESKLVSSYLMHNLNSPIIVSRVKSLIGGSASPHLNVGEIRNFLLPIPPQDECEALLSLLEDTLDSIERLEHEIDLQLIKSCKNKQSILASAFSGRM